MRFKSGAALHLFDQLDSTSAEVKRRAAQGAGDPFSPPFWIVALEQTAGYGRRGREWRQAVGDFAGTLALRPAGGVEAFGEISFIAGLAVADAVSACGVPDAVSLKWPNDLLVGRAKLAGLLLELIETPTGPALAVGVGINIVSRPDIPDYPTARLGDLVDETPAPAALAGRIDDAFWRRYADWRGNGFAPVRRAWLDRAAGLGGPIDVRLADRTISGVFSGIDEKGALLLDTGTAQIAVNAGDVFFPAPTKGS